MSTLPEYAAVKKTDVLQRIALWMQNPKTANGELATLRRMEPSEPEAAYAAIYQFLGENAHTQSPDHLARWALILHCLALVRGRHQSQASTRFGAALVEINYGEARTQMLLRAEFEVLRDVLPRLARRLHANGVLTDWWPIAHLILDTDVQRAREQIVRDYLYAANAKKAA